jgi:hypothetical protein
MAKARSARTSRAPRAVREKWDAVWLAMTLLPEETLNIRGDVIDWLIKDVKASATKLPTRDGWESSPLKSWFRKTFSMEVSLKQYGELRFAIARYLRDKALHATK